MSKKIVYTIILITFFIIILLYFGSLEQKVIVTLPIDSKEEAIEYSKSIPQVQDFLKSNPEAQPNSNKNEEWVVSWKKSGGGIQRVIYVYIDSETGNITNIKHVT